MFVELNDKDAYCAHRSFKDVDIFMNIDTFMNIFQLKVTQIWNMRLNEYSRYWSLKALKSVTVTLYKLRMNTKASIYIMFRNCIRLERNVFVTQKEYDVNEQNVDERKECWERKKRLSHIWVKSESNLTNSLISSVQSWYACNSI